MWYVNRESEKMASRSMLHAAKLPSSAAISASCGASKLGSRSRSSCQCRRELDCCSLKASNSGSKARNVRGLVTICSALAAAAQPSTRTSERTLQLPVDYYQILGAEANYTADAITRAYEARLKDLPTEGFSQEALKARREILKVACDTLADRDLRYEYDNGLRNDEAGTLILEVPWSKIPGALCLLQEVGEAEVVLQVGQALLDERLAKPHHQDVVLVMALAYVELSREAMADHKPAVVRSCDMLNAALRLLQNEGGRTLARALQEQIYETLEEITPRCVLDLLALPLDEEHEAQRQEGLQEARNILWAAGEGGLMAPVGGFTREQFMKEAFSCMTSAEQVAFFTETPSNIPAEKLEVYSVALAHVAEGFVGKRPQLIEEAGTLFLQLQENMSQKDDPDERRDVNLGRALSMLLLGDVDSCRNLLGLDDRNSPFRCSAVVEFVFASSDEAEENYVLSGMCKLLESWLSEEVFENFRNTVSYQGTLSDYFDDPKVLAYLEKREKGASAAAISRIGGAALDSVKTTFQKVFRPEAKVSEDSAALEDDMYTTTPRDEVLPASRHAKQGRASAALQIACIGALFGGFVVAGYRYAPFREKLTTLWNELPAQLSSVVSTVFPDGKGVSQASTQQDKTEEQVVTRMDAGLAEQLIRRWQSAKAQALGKGHSTSQLQEVLGEQMLKSWTERALEVAKHGWYWDYKLLDLSIDSVTISEDGRRAMVEATLQEVARLFDDKHPEHNDAYKSSYTTRYELSHGRSGWKITGGAVLRT